MRVRLEFPTHQRQNEFLALVRRSRALHSPWVSPPATPEKYQQYLEQCATPNFRGFLIVQCQHDTSAGVANVSSITGGNLQSAYLGFYSFASSARQGLMREGLSLVLNEAFTTLRLHRIEANIQPGNTASLQLVQRLGFRREGFSPRYLKVRGRWRDHERWALLAEEWRENRRRSR